MKFKVRLLQMPDADGIAAMSRWLSASDTTGNG
jgi:hypothetical protein